MNKIILINGNDIDTTFNFDKDNEYVKIEIDCDCNLNLEINDSSLKVILFFAKSIKVNLVHKLLVSNNLSIKYYLSNDSTLNEFVINDKDSDIAVNKEVIILDNAQYETSLATLGDCNFKYNVLVDLNAQGASAIHNIAAISKEKYKKVFDIKINNNLPHTYGELNNFGVVKDNATLIFNGTGFIKNKAIQSQAHQSSKIITFNDGVNAQANPYLIIDENDVEASHAAAVGAMDEEVLFYLQSRGINFEQASQLITYGYLNPIINKINNEEIKKHLLELMESKVGL